MTRYSEEKKRCESCAAWTALPMEGVFEGLRPTVGACSVYHRNTAAGSFCQTVAELAEEVTENDT
jgi:hypothetical protein